MSVDTVYYIDCPNCKAKDAELFNGEEECLVCGYSNFNNPPYYNLKTLNERREESWNDSDLPTFVDDENDEELWERISYKDSKYFLTELPKQTYGITIKKVVDTLFMPIPNQIRKYKKEHQLIGGKVVLRKKHKVVVSFLDVNNNRFEKEFNQLKKGSA